MMTLRLFPHDYRGAPQSFHFASHCVAGVSNEVAIKLDISHFLQRNAGATECSRKLKTVNKFSLHLRTQELMRLYRQADINIQLLFLFQMNIAINKDAAKTLEYFREWQNSINPKEDSHPNHHDVAILLTR